MTKVISSNKKYQTEKNIEDSVSIHSNKDSESSKKDGFQSGEKTVPENQGEQRLDLSPVRLDLTPIRLDTPTQKMATSPSIQDPKITLSPL